MISGVEERRSFTHSDPTPVTISDRIFAVLRQEIVEGQIPAGSKISEPELAARHGISRGPLRDALGRLEAAGLVVRKPNVGARVVALTSQRLLEIFAIREALEGMAARLAAENMTAPQISSLRELLAVHGAQIASQDGETYFQREGDLDFHYRIVVGSGNGQLLDLLANDLYHLMRMYRFQFGMRSKRVPKAYYEHEQIVDAIERRDGEHAELLMRHHIRASRVNVERMLAEQQTEPRS